MPDDKIPGGYILQPRKIDESGVMKEPPIIRELWLYLIRKVNWKDGKLSRGTGFFRFVDIQNDLCWYVGFRKMKYSKPRLTKALRRLCEGNMTATVKATRGTVITVLNYGHYQDPKNYEGNNENLMKKQRRKSRGHTIIKEGKERKEFKEKDLKYSVETSDEIQMPSIFYGFAVGLRNWIIKHKNIKINERQVKTWENDFRLLAKMDLPGEQDEKEGRISDALKWYVDNAPGEFIPVAESGSSFRDKFTRIEMAMKKDTSNINKWDEVREKYGNQHNH